MGGKTSTSTSNVSIPPEVLARYNAINTRAETAASKPFQAFGDTAADYVAQMNAQQAAGTNTINANTGPASAGIDPYITSYTKNVADTTGAYLKQQQEQAQSGALGTAVQSGAFGGDRAGVAAANLQQQNQMAYGKTMADIMNQGYTQALGASQADLNRGLQAGQMQLAAGTMQQQTEQAGKDAMINRFMQEQGLPYQQAQFLANIALGTGVASGSTTTTTQPIGFFQNLATGGKVDGYAEGGGVAGPVSHSKEAIGGLGYVPEPNLPIGDLMIAKPLEQQDNNGGDIVSQVLSMIAGKKAEGGSVVRPDLPKKMGRLIPEPSEPVNFMDSRQAKTIAAIPRALLEALNIISADGHAARAEKPIDRETIGREIRGGEKMNEFYGQVEDMKQAIDRKLLGPIASGYNSVGSGVSSRLADLFGTLGDEMVQKTYQDLAGESADKALRYSNEGIFSPKAATPGEIEDRKELAHLTRYASGGVAGGRHGYATDGVVLTPEQEEAQRMRDALRQSLGGVYGNTDDFRQPSPLSRNEIPAAQTLGSLPDAKVEMANTAPVGGVDAILARSQTGPQIGPSGALGLNLPADATNARPGDYKAESMRRFLEEAPKGGVAPTSEQRPMPRPVGLGAAAATAPAEVGATGVAPPATTRQVAKVLGGGKGYTDVEYSDGTRDRVTGNLNIRNNNPGNIEFGSLAQKYGAVGTDGRFAVFPDYETGRKAQESLLFESGVYSGKTIGSAIAKYAPVGDGSNDPVAYANSVAAALGVPVDTPLSALTPEQRNAMISAMEKVEGGGGPSTYSTTPLGSNGSPIPLQIGSPTGGVKPYEDRNAVGKFFNNPEGGLNRNALLSLLSGLGTMASSRSRSPFTAILQGLGGGAETYKDLLKQSAEVTGKNIESVGSLYDLYNKFQFSNPEYANTTLKDFADANGLGYLLPTGSQGQMANVSATTGGMKPITMRDTQAYVETLVDGEKVSIPFMSDYASLSRLAAQWKNAPEGSPQRAAALKAEETIKAIDANGYTTGIGENGQPVVVAVDAARAKMGAALTDQQNVENTQSFRTNAAQSIPNIAPQINAIDRQADIYSKTEAGALASTKGQIGSLASALGINIDNFNDAQQAALVQEALKEKARGIVTRGGGSQDTTDFARSFIDAGSAGPNLEPDAVKKLLVIEKASLLRERDRLSLHSEWQKQAANPYDLNEYESWFANNYPLEEYAASVSSTMPKFVGETGSMQKPHKIGAQTSSIQIGDYFTLPDGRIGQREE